MHRGRASSTEGASCEADRDQAGFALARALEPAPSDYVPLTTTLTILGLTTAGAVGGGWLGHRAYDWAHGTPQAASVRLLVGPGALALAGRF